MEQFPLTRAGPLTYNLQGQEGNRCDLAHGKRICYVLRKTHSWPALYGRHNPQSETMAVHTHFNTIARFANASWLHYGRIKFK